LESLREYVLKDDRFASRATVVVGLLVDVLQGCAHRTTGVRRDRRTEVFERSFPSDLY